MPETTSTVAARTSGRKSAGTRQTKGGAGRSAPKLLLAKASKPVPALTFLFLLIGVPLLYRSGAMDITTVNQLGRFLCVAIVALGIDLVWGYSGILTLCQAMFFCIGGYAIGMHMALHGPLDEHGVPTCLSVVVSKVGGISLPWFWKPFETLPVAVILALLLPGVLAFIIGYFSFRSRVRGVYFSIITQALTLAASQVFQLNNLKLCGTNGLTNFVTLAGFDLTKSSTVLGLYVATVVALGLVYLVCVFVVRSRLGRLLVAVRDNESRLRFASYQPVTLKVFVFVLGAMIAGIGGMLYTPQNGIITPFKMSPAVSIAMVVYVAVGGRGTLSGAVLGALVVSYLESITTNHFPAGWPFLQGGLFVLVTLVIPDGLVGAWRNWVSRDERPGELGIEADAESVELEEGGENKVVEFQPSATQ